MAVTPDTRLSKVLDGDPRVLDYIVSLNPDEFQRLRNPMMRRLMAPRITLGRVAAMVHLPVDELLQHVAALNGAAVGQGQESSSPSAPAAAAPEWVQTADPATAKVVDLLPIDETLDSDPMLPVMVALKSLRPGEVCLIKHKWEPQPLYDVWQKMGTLEWFAQQRSAHEWWIWVRRRPA